MKKQINKPLPHNFKKPSTFKSRAKGILLGLFLFWTICSFISIACFIMLIYDKSKDNSAMITASAAEGDLIYTADLNGLRGMYYNDDMPYISTENVSITMIYNTIGRVSTIELYVGEKTAVIHSNSASIQWEFISPTDYSIGTEPIVINTVFNGLEYIDDTYILESIQYARRLPSGLAVYFTFRATDTQNTSIVEISFNSPYGYDLRLPNYYEEYVNDYVLTIRTLQNRITQLEQQIAVNASIIAQKDSRIDSLLAENNDLALEIAELNAQLEDIQSSYSQAYDNGYNEGYREGGLASGNDSYNKGYADAMEDAGDNGFRGLIGALIDVPVKAMSSLLDWNLLGVNLKEFFFSILSVIVVICIAKLFMGG